MQHTVRSGTRRPLRQDDGSRTSTRTRARPCIVLLLLVGLWMMHGLSGATGAGCHGAAIPVPAAISDGMSDGGAAPALMTSAPTAKSRSLTSPSMSAAVSVPMLHGDLCVSGQPPTPGQDLLALLALGALLLCGLPGMQPDPLADRDVRWARWRAPPAPFGIRLLTTVCVSRT